MIHKNLLLLFLLLCYHWLFAQDYTNYMTGDPSDVSPTPVQGVCLMGGATENDEAMKWFLNRANGGDVLVLRASGSDGYNDYFYTELGVTIHSVETIVINNASGAVDPYVLQQVEDAEAIWFAGGDQYDYVSYFKDTAMEDALNSFINNKQGVIGGTSAGMAILGGYYFDAANGTVTTGTALGNPYHPNVSIGNRDFLEIPYLEYVITDTHYDDPDRRGRHSAFMARIATDFQERPIGIACEEYTSVCIDEAGMASVYGDYPEFDDYAYVLQPNCAEFQPEVCEDGEPLTWIKDNDAVRAYKIPGTFEGSYKIDLNQLIPEGEMGSWEHWTIDGGVFNSEEGVDPQCYLLESNETTMDGIRLYPNPMQNILTLETGRQLQITIYSVEGQVLLKHDMDKTSQLDVSRLSSGVYLYTVVTDTSILSGKLVKS